MTTSANLKASPRQDTGKSATRKMRQAGRVPAVIYGHGEDTRLLTIDAHELQLLFKRVHWENTIIELDIEGEGAPVRTLVREVQAHAYRPDLLHVDFQQIHAGERLHVAVPIRLTGNAPGVKAGGVMMHVVDELQIWCTPDRIPEVLELDVSGMDVGDSLHVRDLTLPEGVETDIDGDRTVCSLTPPTVAAASSTEDAGEAEGVEPEVIGRDEAEDDE